MKNKEIIDIPDLDGEVWTDIDGYDGLYQVSNLGRIKSLNHRQPIIRKPIVSDDGYYRVALWKKGKRKNVSIARLVAKYFVPNDDPINKNTVDHINMDKSQNVYWNLQWLSLSDNIKEYYKQIKKQFSP